LTPVPPLHREQVPPAVSLPSSLGRRVSLSEFRQKQNVVLVFFVPGDPVEALLNGLEALPARLLAHNIAVVGIAPVPPPEAAALAERLGTSFPILSDESLRVSETFTAIDGNRPRPAVVVLDRYGAVQERWVSPDLPSLQQVLDAVELIELRCPE
jgi:peroxiredoxin